MSSSPRDAPRRLVVGTAGHVDHGKTTLVEALTGIDCDRWVQEKQRGITIDLGFAHLEADLPGGATAHLSFVDVPGHERFVHNALAGLGGVRLMMLVVAADEGVKPQTREHLSICTLLDIPAALVVLTKSDLVDAETLELARLELEDELVDTPFAQAPTLAVSAKTGEGIDELRRHLLEHAAGVPEEDELDRRPARLPVDRAFHLQGLGVVVTGTLQAGTLERGRSLDLFPGDASARIRSLQVHGEDRELVRSGDRTSAQLAAVELDRIGRGTQLADAEALPAARGLLVAYRHLGSAGVPLQGSTEVRFHHLTSETMARIRTLDGSPLAPGEEAVCVVHLRQRLSAWRGDHFVIRRASPMTTLGGGIILDPEWRKPRGRDLSRHGSRLSGRDRDAVREWILVGRERGCSLSRLARRLGRTREDAGAIVASLEEDDLALSTTLAGEPLWVAPALVRELAERAKSVLDGYFREERLAETMPKARFLGALLPAPAQALGDQYLQWLEAAGAVADRAGAVALPGRGSGITDEESDLARRIVAAYDAEGLTPRSPQEIQRELGAAPKVFEGVLRHLSRQRKVVRLPEGLFVSASVLADLERQVLAEPWEEISVADFKDRFGLTRKWAIPLLEYLDARQVTRRRGNARLVLRRAGKG